MKRRSLRGSLRPEPGEGLDAGGRRRRPRAGPAGSRRRRCAGRDRRRAAAGSPRARPRRATSRRPGPSRARASRRARRRPGRWRPWRRPSSPAANAWITNGTLRADPRTSDSGSRPCSCAPPSPTVLTISTTRSGRSSRNTPIVIVPGRQPPHDVAHVGRRSTWRGLPATNMNPRASAPRATASRASSSFVMPQIFTNTRTTVPDGSGAGTPFPVSRGHRPAPDVEDRSGPGRRPHRARRPRANDDRGIVRGRSADRGRRG